MSFKEVKCSDCGGPVKGLQLTEEQRRWLDVIKDTVILHMKQMEQDKDSYNSIDYQGWLAIAEPFLFLYGYMISREDRRDS